MRSEPPPSVPMLIGASRAYEATAAPPLDPPGVKARFHGFAVGPNSLLSVMPVQPNAGVLLFARRIAPARLSAATAAASSVGTKSLNNREPKVVRTPAVGRVSFTVNG